MFGIAIALNVGFVLLEFFYGYAARSMALMADAGHNASDVVGLVLAWWAVVLARRQPDRRYTYGLRSSSILAALANAVLLLVACGGIAWEAMHRFFTAPHVSGTTVSLVAGIGIVVNGFSAFLLSRGSAGDVNVRGAYWHMVADTAVSLGVVVSGMVIAGTGWFWVDPAVSLAIVGVIVVGTWGLLKDSVDLALQAVPAHIDLQALQHYLNALPGVVDVHDVHVWGMSTRESALTAHLVVSGKHPGNAFLDNLAHELEERFSIHHVTVQLELGPHTHDCPLLDRGRGPAPGISGDSGL